MAGIFRRLEITDGTTRVDLLAERSGFHCTDWQPIIVQPKDRGTWRDSPLADGRRLVIRKLDNAIERYELQVRNWEPDAVARDTQRLRRLLEKAVEYWTSRWQDDPVWIIAQSPLETNARYALIHNYSTPRDGFPYGQPFWPQIGRAAFEDFDLLLERGHWMENAPEAGTAIEASALEAYDGRNLGNVDSSGDREATTDAEVYVANKRNEANITDVYHRDPGNGWSANLMDAALPYALFDGIATDNSVYFGIDTSLADSGPFCSLVFDISMGMAGPTDVDWEYWNGANWVDLTVQDNTNNAGAMGGLPFDTVGVGSVHWQQPSDWTALNLNTHFGGAAPNITGFWVRCYIVTGGAGLIPMQRNRDVYSITWPYAEVQAAQVGGDISALMQAKVYNQSGRSGGLAMYSDRIVCGLRSMGRGESFTAYINMANEQNPAGITIAPDPTDSAFADDVTTPTGRRITYNPAAARALATEVSIHFDQSIAPDYYGVYHAFLRCQQSGGSAGDVWAQLWSVLGALAGNVRMQSETRYTQTTGQWETLDFGQIVIPPMPVAATETTGVIYLNLQLGCADPPPDLYLYDLILIPVDEWSFDAAQILNDASTTSQVMYYTNYMNADSITRPKNIFRTPIFYTATDYVYTYYPAAHNGPAMLQANNKQRLWFFSERPRSDTTSPYLPRYPHPWIAHKTQFWRVQRYYSLRGDR